MQKPNHLIRGVRSPRDDGFTLIELSIVLVIIGLIAGGVLVGRDLIATAQARSLMSQMEKIQAASTTFRLKYNCKAGDCANATQFGLDGNGNGDGYVGAIGATNPSSSFSWPYCAFYGAGGNDTCITAQPGEPQAKHGTNRNYGEAQHYWAHLSAAGLIDDTIVGRAFDSGNMDKDTDLYFPKDALGKYYLDAFMWNSKLYVRTGLTALEALKGGSEYGNAPISSTQMQYIQTKLGLSLNLNATNGYPDALAQNYKVHPLGLATTTAGVKHQVAVGATAATPATEFTPCAISDGSGGYKYNIANGGNCNLMWQIDY